MSDVSKKELYFALCVAVTAFLVYANSLGNGFAWDDTKVILNNPVLQGSPVSLFSSIDTVSDAMLSPYYRPLTLLSFYLEKQVHNFNPFLVRLLNVLLHSSNAFLLYYLARSLFTDRYAALLTGLLFAVHPLHTEGVDFNSGGRNTMLACLFVLAAYLLHHRSIIQKKHPFALAGAILFLAGLFSKESALAVAPFILALEIPALREKTAGAKLTAFLRLAPYIVATCFYLVMRWMTLSKLGVQTSIIPGLGTKTIQSMYIIPSLGSRLLDNIYIIPRYLLTIIRPTALSPVYAVPDDLNLLALPLFAGWLCIILALGWFLTRGRSYATIFGLSWLIAFWLPISGILYFPSAPLADRYLYLPALGLWLIVADQAVRFTPNNTTARSYTIAIALIIMILAAFTIRRNLDWKSELALFSRVVEQYPEDARGHASLAGSYHNAQKQNGDYPALAEQHYEMALALDPAIQIVHTPLGHLKLDRGDLNGALHHYNEALNIFPYDKEARLNRGITYEKLGMLKEALTDFSFFLTTPGYNVPGSRDFVEEKIRQLSQANRSEK